MENTIVNANQSQSSIQVSQKFGFKVLSEKEYQEAQESFIESYGESRPLTDMTDCFSYVKETNKAGDKIKREGWLRKEEKVTLTLPEFCVGLPRIAVDAIQKVVADYVRRKFISEYMLVGDHSWQAIESDAAERARGGAALTLDKEIAAFCSESIFSFILAKTGKEAAAEKFQKMFKGRLTEAVILKQAQQYDLAVIVKLQEYLDLWAEYVSDNEGDEESLACYIEGYEGFKAILAKHEKEKSAKEEDFLDML